MLEEQIGHSEPSKESHHDITREPTARFRRDRCGDRFEVCEHGLIGRRGRSRTDRQAGGGAQGANRPPHAQEHVSWRGCSRPCVWPDRFDRVRRVRLKSGSHRLFLSVRRSVGCRSWHPPTVEFPECSRLSGRTIAQAWAPHRFRQGNGSCAKRGTGASLRRTVHVYGCG